MRTLNLTVKVWRQDGPDAAGQFETIPAPDINDDMSFLEMLDVVNERLTNEGREPITFDHDCREGICGTCSLMINGQAHGPAKGTATCQLHMRKFHDGQEIVIEPWRATAFPVVKDLMVDRSAFDRIVEAGGYITAPTGGPRDANLILVPKVVADAAMDARSASGAGPAWPPAPTVPRTSSPRRSPTSTCCPRGSPSAPPRRGDGHHDGGALRLLHQPRRVRGRLPEEHLHRLHRPHEQGLPQGQGVQPAVPQPHGRGGRTARPRDRREVCR